MIGWLKGVVVEKQPPLLVLDVNGVGYEIEAPMSTFFSLPKTGEGATLLIHMVVREDAMLLYGFATQSEKKLFRELIKISGVGAKMALTILSGSSVNDFTATVMAGDADKLTGLPGVGKKTAARLIVEMRDRLGSPDMLPQGVGLPENSVPGDAISEAHHALTALGYKPAEATRLLKDASSEDSSEALIRQALKRAVK